MKLAAYLLLVVVLVAGCTTPGPEGSQVRVGYDDGPTVRADQNAPEPAPDDVSGAISGRVTDDELIPIPNATIFDQAQTFRTMTDAAGRFTVNGITAGPYRIVAEASGFFPQVRAVEVTTGTAVTLSFALMPVHEADVPLVRSVARDFYVQASFVGDSVVYTIFDGAKVGVNRSMICGACSSVIHFEGNPVQLRMEGTWNGATLATNNNVTFSIGYRSDKGSWSQHSVSMANKIAKDLPDASLASMVAGQHQRFYHNVSALVLNVGHRLTAWDSLAYVERLPQNFSALPKE